MDAREVARLTRSKHMMFFDDTECTGCHRIVRIGYLRPSATRWYPYHSDCLVKRYEKQQAAAKRKADRLRDRIYGRNGDKP